MDIERRGLLPDPSLERREMEALQLDVADGATFQGSLDTSDDLIVAGIDQGFYDDQAVSAVVVVEDGEIIEKAQATRPVKTPYIPGLLSYREGEAVIAALRKLDVVPDLLLFDGSGRIHYRQAGLATHIGVVFDTASVGVAKNLLCGNTKRPGTLDVGETRPVRADKSIVNASNGTLLGSVFQSSQYDSNKRSINPLYVSPGHKVSVDQAAQLVSRFCDSWKLPEPIHVADRLVDECKRDVVQ